MRGAIAFSLLIACSGVSQPAEHRPDAPPPDTHVAASCQALADQFDAAVAMGLGTCTADDDCDVIGGQFGDWYCDGRPSIGDCAGTAIARNAPGYVAATTAAADFFASCFDSHVHSVYDCAPVLHATCNAQGYCAGPVVGSCFPPLPDAGP
jgi:hypothetical protein